MLLKGEQVINLFEQIVLEKGFLSKVRDKFSNSITVDQLMSIWKLAGFPKKSDEIENILVKAGVKQSLIDKLLSNFSDTETDNTDEEPKLRKAHKIELPDYMKPYDKAADRKILSQFRSAQSEIGALSKNDAQEIVKYIDSEMQVRKDFETFKTKISSMDAKAAQEIINLIDQVKK